MMQHTGTPTETADEARKPYAAPTIAVIDLDATHGKSPSVAETAISGTTS